MYVCVSLSVRNFHVGSRLCISLGKDAKSSKEDYYQDSRQATTDLCGPRLGSKSPFGELHASISQPYSIPTVNPCLVAKDPWPGEHPGPCLVPDPAAGNEIIFPIVCVNHVIFFALREREAD